jgi:hypothetical protein
MVDLSLIAQTPQGCKHPSCPECDPIVLGCYLIVPCDGTPTIISNNISFEDYLNQFITVISSEYTGCAYVVKLEDTDCETAIDIYPDPDLPCSCIPNCYFIENSKGFYYVDVDDVLTYVSSMDANPYIKLCSKVPPIFDPTDTNYTVLNLGGCDDAGQCIPQCYKLTNCSNLNDIIYTTSQSVLPYIVGGDAVITILGQEGCWTPSFLKEGDICDCPIDVTVIASYISCEECIGYVSYKLTSCDNNDTIYTLTDLSAYIDKVIKIDCGCYTIEQLDILPPNYQEVIVIDSYEQCIQCSRTYWLLTDCQDKTNTRITYTDLSAYVGQSIKIDGCTECWIVSPTDIYLNATEITVIANYIDCIACNIDLPCICTILTNYGDKPKEYVYLDCDKKYQFITLQPGESSDRVCAIAWYTVPQCTCFVVKLTIEPIPGNPTSDAFLATAIPGQEINGYPVYELCTGPTCGTVSFDGTYWVIYDPNGAPTYQLTNNQSISCVFGDWEYYGGEPFPETFAVESYSCPTVCNCITLEVYSKGVILLTYTLSIVGYDNDLFPIYGSSDGVVELIRNSNSGCWELFSNSVNAGVSLCRTDCPVGTFLPQGPVYYVTKDCTQPIIYPADFTLTDYFQRFGECQHGVCLPPTFRNDRTIRPGYNTPACTTERYDEITCHFANIMYKIVLEKRYGITNCCPDDDEKWLLLKELIDLQALKDPNYKCPDCACPCNSGKTYSTCNCGN